MVALAMTSNEALKSDQIYTKLALPESNQNRHLIKKSYTHPWFMGRVKMLSVYK